jgi:hypothetical protein
MEMVRVAKETTMVIIHFRDFVKVIESVGRWRSSQRGRGLALFQFPSKHVGELHQSRGLGGDDVAEGDFVGRRWRCS